MKTAVICIYAVLFFSIFNCEKDKDITEPEKPASQILFYSSFEKNGQPNNNGWFIKDESSANYSTDVPPGGGDYSMCLKVDSIGPFRQWAQFSVPASNSNNIYKLSFWSKPQGACGIAHVYIKLSDTTGYYSKSKLACDSTWSYYSITDTIQTDENDSLVIILAPDLSWTVDAKAYFDLCKLEKLNSNWP